ncbi:phosphoribosylglycinamide formyltransferase [Fulvivirga sp. 29W222]|uniref:Phosphoribosylglycinamide formyltransferase n=1 Tax=Fulvivirga marina TaxID=2494733 RepID=A0A937FV05_9BACT|nr:phosphoribosylglycinamide formyltransferase [Fulvivirga marina]MBL6446549.1 phosphoribosylglycinamide formyltransferase [Fulvivirga marina]
MTKIAIFASGSGSNAERIIEYFKGNAQIEVSLILTNNPEAYVLERAKRLQVPAVIFGREDLMSTDKVLSILKEHEIDFVVLAGFLLLVPGNLVDAYPDRIINIHPALLPKFGGKGMYGDRVHQAVKSAGEAETGISIHYVNKKYDEGEIIFQAKCPVAEEDTPEIVADKVHQLEYQHYPQVIESVINNSIKNL